MIQDMPSHSEFDKQALRKALLSEAPNDFTQQVMQQIEAHETGLKFTPLISWRGWLKIAAGLLLLVGLVLFLPQSGESSPALEKIAVALPKLQLSESLFSGILASPWLAWSLIGFWAVLFVEKTLRRLAF